MPEDLDVSTKIKTVVRQVVDEFHPHVQTLLEAGYDLEPSIQAIDQFGDPEAAMNYLESNDKDSDKGGIFQQIGSEDMEITEEIYEKYVLRKWVRCRHTCILY